MMLLHFIFRAKKKEEVKGSTGEAIEISRQRSDEDTKRDRGGGIPENVGLAQPTAVYKGR